MEKFNDPKYIDDIRQFGKFELTDKILTFLGKTFRFEFNQEIYFVNDLYRKDSPVPYKTAKTFVENFLSEPTPEGQMALLWDIADTISRDTGKEKEEARQSAILTFVESLVVLWRAKNPLVKDLLIVSFEFNPDGKGAKNIKQHIIDA